MSDSEDTTCPLCMEEMDLIDRNFVPCPCGYRVCMWCWHHIRENLNGLCPACRVPYKEDPHAFAAVDRTEVVKKNKERKQKEKQERKVSDRPVAKAQPVDRRHLHNYRVIQRNLVYIIGVPGNISTEDTLRKAEYFGQYGKISKIVIHRNHTSSHATVSAYISFSYKEDAKAAIQALEGFWLDGHHLRASFGTTKYCNNFIRGVPCNNPECVYLHELGEDEDRFTKEEIQAGHSKLMQPPGKDQTIVTGGGGPSGTGKRTTGEPIFPPPVFVQDIATLDRTRNISFLSVDSPKSKSSDSVDTSDDVMEDSSVSFPPIEILPPAVSAAAASASKHPPSISAASNVSHNNTNNVYSDQNIVGGKEGVMGNGKTGVGANTSVSGAGGGGGGLSTDSTTSVATADSISTLQSTDATVNSSKIRSEGSTDSSDGISSYSRGGAMHAPSDSSQIPTSASNTNSNAISQQQQYIQNQQTIQQLTSKSSSTFNGLSNSAVFPVPVSSLSLSVWTHILGCSNSDLKINPFALVALPITELFELTLPPVDASSISPWPKPISYYSAGCGVNGQTHGPVSQHIYYKPSPQYDNHPSNSNSSADQPNLHYNAPPPSNSNNISGSNGNGVNTFSSQQQQQFIQPQARLLPTQQQQVNHQNINSSNSSNSNSSNSNGRFNITSQSPQRIPTPPYSSNGSNQAPSNYMPSSSSSSSAPTSTSALNSNPPIAALQQMFPSVNMSFAPRAGGGSVSLNMDLTGGSAGGGGGVSGGSKSLNSSTAISNTNKR